MFSLVEPVRILFKDEVRAVCTTDVMTATVAEIPHELMVHITERITHEVAGINRVLYDFTPKPTETVEFEYVECRSRSDCFPYSGVGRVTVIGSCSSAGMIFCIRSSVVNLRLEVLMQG